MSNQLPNRTKGEMQIIENNLFATDPTAGRYIYEMFSYLKEKENKGLSIIEKMWILAIEREFLNETEFSVKHRQIQWIKNLSKYIKQSDYYLEGERGHVFRKMQEHADLVMNSLSLQSSLGEIERYVEKLFQLDYSAKPIRLISKEGEEDFHEHLGLSLLASSLEMINEKYRLTTVSRKTVDLLTDKLGVNSIIITDSQGFIRYINEKAVRLIGFDYNYFIGKSIQNYLSESDDMLGNLRYFINKKYAGSLHVNVMKETVSIPTSEIDEVVYIISESKKKKQEIELLDSILTSLEEHIESRQGLLILNDLKNSMKRTQLVSKESIAFYFTENMDTKTFIETKFEKFTQENKYPNMNVFLEIHQDLRYSGEISPISSILDLIMEFYSNRNPNRTKLEANFIASNLHNMLVLSISCYTKTWGENSSENTCSAILSELEGTVKAIKGMIDVKDKIGKGNTIVVFLPYFDTETH